MIAYSAMSSQRDEYIKYIQSTRWRKKRDQFMKSNLPKDCFVCGVRSSSMDLHHRTYKRLGNEKLTDLVLVCRSCHGKIHEYAKLHPNKGLWHATSRVRRAARKKFKNKNDLPSLKPSQKIVQSSGAKKRKNKIK